MCSPSDIHVVRNNAFPPDRSAGASPVIIEAAITNIDTGDRELVNFASWDILDIALSECEEVYLEDWRLTQGDKTIAVNCSVKGNAEPALMESLRNLGLPTVEED